MSENIPWTREEFEQQLRAKEEFYHIRHPLHVKMHSGEMNKEQIQMKIK